VIVVEARGIRTALKLGTPAAAFNEAAQEMPKQIHAK
jgi:hypothetical protein